MSLTQEVSKDQPEQGESPCDEVINPAEVAKSVGLRYVSDTSPGIGRKRAGKHFSYIGLDSKPIRNPKELERIKSLGIPPAWTNVWICPRPNGHIQATGRDAKGRKQYRYHPRWREVRDATKYDRMIAFGEALPLIRKQTSHDMSLPGFPYEKVVATVVQLLDATLIRVGNEEYARENNTFGLTTLRSDHVDVSGSEIEFNFRGKRGKEHTIGVKDVRLAKIVKRCQELPGHELFQYYDDDKILRTIESDDVNEYLQKITDQNFTAKDFRTWGGTVVATRTLEKLDAFESETQAKKNVVQAIKAASAELANTPAICRKCYVHPGIIDAYMNGSLLNFLKLHSEKELAASADGLRPDEAVVLAFLRQLSAN